MTTALIVCSIFLLLMMTSSAHADEGYSQNIADEIRGFLLDDDWKFDFDEEKGVFRFGVKIDGKMKSANCRILIRDDSYTSYAISPINADTEDTGVMRNIAEFVCRANYGIKNGNFELDVRDGEIRYKVFVDCDGGQIPTRDIIRGSIIIPAMMFERYSPGILAVIFAGKSAAEAIEPCEN